MKQPWILFVVVGACLVAAEAPRAAGAAARVALLPVVVHSNADQQEFLRQGLGDMLSARLEQQKTLSVVRVEDRAQATTDLQQALAAGRAAGAEYVIYGSFTRFGDGASLDLQCAAVGGSAAGAHEVFVQAGTLGDIIPKLDGVAQRVAGFVEHGPSEPPPVAAGSAPGSAGRVAPDPARGEIEELKRRVTVLEQTVGGTVGGGTGPKTHHLSDEEIAPGDEAASSD
ncbi:MAG TPA: hypothetical protein VMW35_12300 [Myxococcota bacterium]|nr:hypothetical protein [Myxococcota bacterium]